MKSFEHDLLRGAAGEGGIPPQYKDLPPEVLEEIWVPPRLTDPAKDAALQAERTRTLQELKNPEPGIAERIETLRSELQETARSAPPSQMSPDFAEKQAELSADIRTALSGIGRGLARGAAIKALDYDLRIQAVQKGTPAKRGDTLPQLLADFRRAAQVEWRPDLDLSALRELAESD